MFMKDFGQGDIRTKDYIKSLINHLIGAVNFILAFAAIEAKI